MEFAAGIAVGLALASLVVTTLTYFRNPIERVINIAQKKIESAGPKPQGFIIPAMTDVEFNRQEIIKKNDEKGIDTPLKDIS